MVRWRYCLALAVLLLLPSRTGCKGDEDDDDEKTQEADEDDENGDEDEEEESVGEKGEQTVGRRVPGMLMQTSQTIPVTRTTKKRPLECYVCAYKSDSIQVRACLDPTKYRVHTMTCHSADDKCFTSVISKGSSYEAVVRGCRSSCIGTPEVTCCELNRCNHQAFAMPTVEAPPALALVSKATKSLSQSVLYFITILLALQTVIKVAFV